MRFKSVKAMGFVPRRNMQLKQEASDVAKRILNEPILNIYKEVNISVLQMGVWLIEHRYKKDATRRAARAWLSKMEPLFEVQVRDLDTRHMQELWEHICNMGISDVYKKGVLNFLCAMSKFAIQQLHYKIPKLTSSSFVGRSNAKKGEALSLEQVHEIVKNAKTYSTKEFMMIGFFTGARMGEIFGLKWEDIDFTNRKISINKTRRNQVVNSPKTKSSNRTIDMLKPVSNALISRLFRHIGIKVLDVGDKDLMEVWDERLQEMYEKLKEKFVFENGNHTSMNQSIQLAQVTAGIKKPYTSHIMRHTFASLMIKNGEEHLWVSKMLGHASLNMTYQTYAHFIPCDEKRASFAEKLNWM